MKRVATFGEIMLRLASPHHQRLGQAQTLEMSFGGGEANVAAALAAWGHDVRFLTRLPDNPLGHACRDRLRGAGVDTRYVAWGGQRLGVYFLETGAAQRGGLVLYDRAGQRLRHGRRGRAQPADGPEGRGPLPLQRDKPRRQRLRRQDDPGRRAGRPAGRGDGQLRPELPLEALDAPAGPPGDDPADEARRLAHRQ